MKVSVLRLELLTQMDIVHNSEDDEEVDGSLDIWKQVLGAGIHGRLQSEVHGGMSMRMRCFDPLDGRGYGMWKWPRVDTSTPLKDVVDRS